jgi:RNA polymerase sigma factor (sigma-70 family)
VDLCLDEERALVLKALSELPEDFRVVLTLRYLHELSPKQIAERLQKPRGTIRSRLHHALAKLQQQLTTHKDRPSSVRMRRALDAPPPGD